ncbi:MAG TPA: VOC family protein [Ilumatobacteraceae bacterium]|nr:VOC family protein [Ilumatobacteraceae bacterium]
MSLHPYLFFTNRTREAMTRYQEILGGQLDIMNLADLPASEETPFDAPADFVIHAALSFGDGNLLMASDDPGGDGTGVKGAAVNYTLADADEARRVFAALADGGSVGMALGETFWSPLFGSCVDRFGVSWMVNVEPQGVN